MNNTVRFIVRVAIFGAIAGILYIVPFLSFNIPIFPPFLKFHFDEIPIFIAGFAYGPWTALAVILVRGLIKLPWDIGETMGVGVLADVIFSMAFVLPAAFIYKYKKDINGAIIGLVVGVVCQLVTAMIGNVYFIIPFYLFLFQMSEEQLLAICQVVVPNMTDLKWSYAFTAVLPFNVIKDGVVFIVTLLVYKPLHRVINKFAKQNEKPAN